MGDAIRIVSAADIDAVRWLTPEGEPVTCLEKLKILGENLSELRSLAQDALEDAVVMGCDEGQVRQVLQALIDGLDGMGKR